MLIEASLLLSVLNLNFFERLVRYRLTIFGLDGKNFKLCRLQNPIKSDISDLYARIVLSALELLRLSIVSA